jgi:hypothetical protein
LKPKTWTAPKQCANNGFRDSGGMGCLINNRSIARAHLNVIAAKQVPDKDFFQAAAIKQKRQVKFCAIRIGGRRRSATPGSLLLSRAGGVHCAAAPDDAAVFRTDDVAEPAMSWRPVLRARLRPFIAVIQSLCTPCHGEKHGRRPRERRETGWDGWPID